MGADGLPSSKENESNRMNEKPWIEVEIWSDIMCPFCYLGKHRFEKALEQFYARDKVGVTWKSFQLNPGIVTDASVSIYQYLSQNKGIPFEKAVELNARITEEGKQEGLVYDFDKVIVANTFRAHILLHLAKKAGKQGVVKEALFRAFFSEGRNIDDPAVLKAVAADYGLDPDYLNYSLDDEAINDEVRTDFYEARQLGINSVPFFVFNKRYGISGAQDPSLFLQMFNKLTIQNN
ncbi:MAG: DsbA family oxidoreductase [Bacteroidales bacterium]